ncbi:MAG: metallothionein [Trichodesmium sp. St5_bin2_1]|nr:metallothionein [Trichodesmium sp. St5_bin2_1]MDE5081795.1 metallothionein [Trichodesmium sp. St18_bin1]MDE5124524.1 metallothionein [Trichodesmium sp. St19_bin1]
MSEVTLVKCACADCLCVVSISTAVKKDGSYYCSEECSNGHSSGVNSCSHNGCNCSGQ